MRYLDPKADLTFKKVFGEHPDLVISLLNALLPFDKPEEEIKEIGIPDSGTGAGDTAEEKQHRRRALQRQSGQAILGGDADALVDRLYATRALQRLESIRAPARRRESKYELLQPVYSLNLVNDIFLPDVPTLTTTIKSFKWSIQTRSSKD